MTCKITPNNITSLEPNQIFVFGSNEAGIHGAGAALFAKQKLGARQYIGIGFTGQCYALPTKDTKIRTLPLDKIKAHVDNFYMAVIDNPDRQFLVTKIGCGYAGYTEEDIAPLFSNFISLENISLPIEFIRIISNHI